jgi:hypothetical protein
VSHKLSAAMFVATVSYRNNRGFFPRTRQIHKFPISIRKRPNDDARRLCVQDCHTFVDERFSCRELRRIVGIALNWTIAGQKGMKASASNQRYLGRAADAIKAFNAR